MWWANTLEKHYQKLDNKSLFTWVLILLLEIFFSSSTDARMRRITIHLQSLEGKEDQKPDFLRSDDGVSDSESDQMETNDASDIIFMTNPSQIDDRTGETLLNK